MTSRRRALLSGWDKKHLWHPFTQQADWKSQDLLIVESARGMYLKDASGRRYMDGVSSLWVTVHGHNHPALNQAITRQLRKTAHSTFLGLTHEPAILLGRELVKIAPKGLSRVFYSDNGATAVEVALKMAYQYWLEKGESRPEFLALGGSYHGDTLGAVSVGGIHSFHKKFKPLLFKTRFAMSPHCYRCPYRKKGPGLGGGSGRRSHASGYAGRFRPDGTPSYFTPKPGDFRAETGCRWECLGEVEKTLKRRSRRLSAAIVEPLVQGASGMRVMPAGYFKGFARLCRRYGVLLIADEVATGFGRTGKMFAVEHEGTEPDFLCLAKSITGGTLPLAATLTREGVYRAFLGKFDKFKAFYHGHTYTANPLACAAALANLKLYKSTRLLTAVGIRARQLRSHLRKIRALPHVGDVRQMGLMAAVELVRQKSDGTPYPPGFKAGQKVCRAALARGLWIRPLGDVVVILPPLAIRGGELGWLLRTLRESMEEALPR